MKFFRGPSVLISFGFATGLIVGMMALAPLFPPQEGKAWLEIYGGALGAMMTGIAAFIVAIQIATSERHHRVVLEGDYRRAVAAWNRTDGNLAYVANFRRDAFFKQIEIIKVRNPNFTEQTFRGPILMDPTALQKVAPLGNITVLTQGASPAVAEAFIAADMHVKEYNSLVEMIKANHANKVEITNSINDEFHRAVLAGAASCMAVSRKASMSRPTLTGDDQWGDNHPAAPRSRRSAMSK